MMPTQLSRRTVDTACAILLELACLSAYGDHAFPRRMRAGLEADAPCVNQISPDNADAWSALSVGHPADLGALQRQVEHQALVGEHESDDRLLGGIRVDGLARAASSHGYVAIDAHLPGAAFEEAVVGFARHEQQDHLSLLRTDL